MASQTPAPRLYLAGFDVFRVDAREHGEALKRLCAAHGFTGLYPLDNDLPPGLEGPQAARWICEANLELIRRADGVMANLNPFRGHEPDSGTAFEVGFAIALGKPVWAYTRQAGTIVRQVLGREAAPGEAVLDADGFTVENFGLNLNLMLACTARVVVGDAADCLAAMAAAWAACLDPDRDGV